VQPLALIFHELAVNAATHGALSHAAGKIKVDWAPQGGGGVNLKWEEGGGNIPAMPSRAGFGTTIVKGLVEYELKGTLESSWQPDGLKLSVEIPSLASV
jgi:two-component sensor histidine kinase